MPRRRCLLWGLGASVGVPAASLAVAATYLAVSYNGICASWLPWVAAPSACTATHYVLGTLTIIVLVLGRTYWPMFILILGLPPVVGYYLDRRRELRQEMASVE